MSSNKKIYFIKIVSALIIFSNSAFSQNDTIFSVPPEIDSKRLTVVIFTQSALYVTSLTGLYYLWYKDYPQSKFHFINDNKEWLLMDKIGHVTTAAYVGRLGYGLYRWAGVDKKKAVWYGGTLGFVYLTTIEILDGFSKEWGASTGDIIANTLGSAVFIGQQLAWDEQRFFFKYSYHKSKYSQYRPDLLGKYWRESILKDYNGQTYWLSGNIKSFSGKKSKVPRWLNIAFGYSVNGLLGANGNPKIYKGNPLPEFVRHSQFFLSADIDLTRIKTKSKILKILFNTFCFIKIPFPTIEYNKINGLKFHAFYF